MAVVEDLERVGVLALDEGHQVLVGESLQRLGCELVSHRDPLYVRRREIGSSGTSATSADSVARSALPTPARRIPRCPASSPARLYCTLVGAVLVIAGIIGFFYSSSFDTGARRSRRHRRRVRDPRRQRLAQRRPHRARAARARLVAGSPSGARTYGARRRACSTSCSAIWGFIDRPGDGILLGSMPGQRRGQRPAPDPRPGSGIAAPARRPARGGPSARRRAALAAQRRRRREARVEPARRAATLAVADAVRAPAPARLDEDQRRCRRRRRRRPRRPGAPSCAGRAAPRARSRMSSSAQLGELGRGLRRRSTSRVDSSRLARRLGRLDRAQRVGEQALEVRRSAGSARRSLIVAISSSSCLIARWISTLVAPSVRPSARAISRLSMPSAKRMISASRRSSERSSSRAITSRSSSRPSTTRSVSCGCAGGSTSSSSPSGRRERSR